MANQNGRAYPGRNAGLPSFHRDDDRERERYGALRDDDRGLDDRQEPGRSWRPEDRGERDERNLRRFDQGFGQGFGDRRSGDPRFGDRDDDRGWGHRERFSESDRDLYGVRDREDRGERDRGERWRDVRGYRDPVETMPRQDQLLRGAYRDHDESGRDLSYRTGRTGEPDRAPHGSLDERPREARDAGGPVRERMAQRRGPHTGKGPVGFQRSDERIRELVCEALTDDGEIDATRIEVSVQGGEVTLTGAIEDRRMKRLADDCVEAVPGVKDVHNQLRIGEPATAADRATTDKHDRHERTAEPPDRKHRPS